jgi:hypothetical protein
LEIGATTGFRQVGGRGPRRIASAKLSDKEEAMLHFSRSASILGAPLTLVALLACVTPAGAAMRNTLSANGMNMQGVSMQGISATAVAESGVPANARITTGSALGDLNGVVAETVVIPEAALR